MSNTNAVILVSILTAGGLHWIAQFRLYGSVPQHYRIVIGMLLLILFLYLMAEVWPDGARGLALVILLTALVMNGSEFFGMVSAMVSGEPIKKPIGQHYT